MSSTVLKRSMVGDGARRLLQDERGATVAELALVAPLFFAILLAIVQIGVLGFMSVNFNDALLSVSRRIRTGQSDGPHSAQDFTTQICARMGTNDCASRLSCSVLVFGKFSAVQPPATLPSDPNKNVFSTGGPGSIVLVTATYKWPLLIPFPQAPFPNLDGTNVLLVSRLVFKNEPYAS